MYLFQSDGAYPRASACSRSILANLRPGSATNILPKPRFNVLQICPSAEIREPRAKSASGRSADIVRRSNSAITVDISSESSKTLSEFTDFKDMKDNLFGMEVGLQALQRFAVDGRDGLAGAVPFLYRRDAEHIVKEIDELFRAVRVEASRSQGRHEDTIKLTPKTAKITLVSSDEALALDLINEDSSHVHLENRGGQGRAESIGLPVTASSIGWMMSRTSWVTQQSKAVGDPELLVVVLGLVGFGVNPAHWLVP